MSHGSSVLVVEDDDDLRRLMGIVLSRAGFVVRAVDGATAALVAARAEAPDFYVLDVRMPGIDGHELCRLLQAEELTRAPVMFVSAESSEVDIAAGYAAGGAAFVAKPFGCQQLVDRAHGLLSTRAA